LIGNGANAPATGNPQGKKSVVTKKTSRSPKAAAPAAPAPETKPARKTPAKARRAAPRKRPAAAAPKTERVATPAQVTDEEVRVRAYYLSLEYQGGHRNDVDFWLLAERELRPVRD